MNVPRTIHVASTAIESGGSSELDGGVRRVVYRYGGAVLAVAAAAGLRWLLQDYFGTAVAFITFFPTVPLVAMFAGGGPCLLATVLSAVVVKAWIGFGTGTTGEAPAMSLFIAAGLLMSTTAEMLQRARRRELAGLAERVAEREQAAATLEQRVAEQTREIRLLASAISHLGEGVMITDDQLEWPGPRIVFVNDALCRMTGYAAEELIGRPPPFWQRDDRDRETWDRVQAELGAHHSSLAELTNHRKGGAPYDAELFIMPLLNSEGRRTNIVSIHRDITKRKQAEEALRREQELNAGIIDSARMVILLLDTAGRIIRFNPYMEELTGRRLAEVRGSDWFDTFLPEGERERVRGLFQRALDGERTRGNVNRILTSRGSELEIEWNDAPLTSAEGTLIGLLCTGQDITERKRAEQALRGSEERLGAVLNTAADAIITIDRLGVINSVNPATERMFGYSKEELLGQSVQILMPAPYSTQDNFVTRYLKTGEARIIGVGREVAGRRKDGSTFPVDLAVSEVKHLGLFTGVVRDITERQVLQREVLAAAEDEQRRIGQDLHDGTQQELAGMGMLAQTLVSKLAQEPGGLSRAHLDRCQDLARKILDGLTRVHREVQAISRGLVSMRLDRGGLMDALRELAARTDELDGVSCALKCEQPVEVVDNVIATHLYRIAQEALTNALKHARPEHILIALEADNGQPVLQVADDGSGFDQARQSPGMGLKTMRYRASLIGANLTIEPVETGGTLVTCRVFSGRGGAEG